MKLNSISKFFLIISLISIVACSNKNEPEKEVATIPEELYKSAEQALEERKYQQAADDYSKVYNEHPYSNLAVKAKIMEAFAYYEKQDFDMAIAITDEFIKLHPGNENVAYAYYLKAMSLYKQIIDIEHDQKITELTKEAMNDLIVRFPDSEYAREAKIKIDLIYDHLAGKEMEVGRFYQSKGDLISAINRFIVVIEKYQTTSHVKEALHRLVECYLTLGIIPEAKKNASILGTNYPESKWYLKTFELMKKYNSPDAKQPEHP